MGQLEPDAYALQTVQAYAEENAADLMIVDYQASTFAREGYVSNSDLPGRKRPASPVMLEDGLPKRKPESRYPHQMLPIDDPMDFSFSNRRDSTRLGNISHSLSRTTSANTSFRSVGTDTNESFGTAQSTPPPRGNGNSKGVPITPREPAITLTKLQKYAQDLMQNSPFGKAEAVSTFHSI